LQQKAHPQSVAKTSLRLRYFRWMGLTLAGLLLAHGLLEGVFTYQEKRAHLGSVQVATAKLFRAKVDNYLGTIERAVKDVADLPWDSGMLSEADRRIEFQRLLKLHPAVQSLSVVNVDGSSQIYVSRVTLDSATIAAQRVKPDMASLAKSGVWYSPPVFSKSSDPLVTVWLAGAKRQNAIADSSASSTIYELNFKFITDVLTAINAEGDGNGYVVDHDWNVIAHRDQSLVLRKTNLAETPAIRALTQIRDAQKVATLGVRNGVLPNGNGNGNANAGADECGAAR
jgi:adenylate cyclase